MHPENGPKAMRSVLEFDNYVTIAILFMPINPAYYKPLRGQSFKFWKKPEIEYELDHAGQFVEISEDEFVCTGGETKWSYTCMYLNLPSLIAIVIRDAIAQIEEYF